MKKTSLVAFLGVSLISLCIINPVSAVGVFRNSEGNWYLDYNNTGITYKALHFGTKGDIPIIGDWNGDRIDGIAIFRPSTGYWYFDNNLDGVYDKSIRFGSSTDQIIKGDWQGTGKDGIALFRPSTGYWYFDNNLDGVYDKSFRYGNPTDRILAGDWDGDGINGIALFRPSTGYWYFDNNLDGVYDKSIRFGSSTDQIIKGDWQGTGKDGIALFRPSTGYWYFDNNLDGVYDKSFRFGDSTDQIIRGDWLGTGEDGIALFRPSTGYWYFDNNLDGVYDKSFRYGNPTDRILAGQWISVIPGAPAAEFIANKRSGSAPLSVTFTDQSTGTQPVTSSWDFTNDGRYDSSLRNPTFIYSEPGTYSVTLSVKNDIGTDSTTKTGYITVTPPPGAPEADFISDTQSGVAPLTVKFADISTGASPLSYAWDFTNDGTTDSNLASPSFTYTTAGSYTVRLTVTNSVGSDVEIKTGYIIVSPASVGPSAGFTANKRAGAAPLTVTFTDQSSGTAPLSYAWDFTNDGTTDSNLKSPTFTYPAAGTYTVRLTVTNSVGSDVEIKTGYIIVSPASVGPSAGFTANKRAGAAPLTVTFTDQSSGTAPLSYAWDFTNDGTTDSNLKNPTFTYPAAGTYTVRLTVTNSVGSDVEIKTGYIVVSPAPVAPVAAFTADKQSGYAPLTVRFTDQSSGTAPLSYAWDFTNDGVNESTAKNPSFTYSDAGTYTVRLGVTNSAGSDVEIKTGYIVVSPAPVAPVAAFTADIRSGYAPLTVVFANQSTGTPPITYEWDFNNDDDVDSYSPNPTFTYTTPGTYTVTLSATNVAGSDYEIKNGYITVMEVPTPPVASFTSNRRSGVAPLTVRFTGTSTGSEPMTYTWDFGDGATSADENPTHTYTVTGTYDVIFTAANSLGTDTVTRTGYITVDEGQSGSHAGIALTFDDQSVDDWYAIRGILQQYGAHATFFVSNFESLGSDKIALLQELKADGNEIGFHGLYHTEAYEYRQTHTVQEYLDYEIIPGIALMEGYGLKPVDFAYPSGHDEPAVTLALQAYFGHIRDTHYAWDDAIYYRFDGTDQAFIAGMGIDDLSYGNTIDTIYDGISRADQDDTVLILYGHTPRETVTGDYQTSHNRLRQILGRVSEMNMKFYTISELP